MPDINTAQFNAPIPGQSLTTELGNRPWEKPAKFTNPNDALNFYMEQLAIPDTTASMLEVLEQGFPATDLVDAITLGGVLQGLHSIDVAVLVSPAIYEVITSVADEAEIEYKSGLNTSEEENSNDASLVSRAIKMATEKGRNKEEDDIKDTEIVEDAENTSTGLMSRPAKDYLVADTDEDEIANDALEEDKDIVEEIE